MYQYTYSTEYKNLWGKHQIEIYCDRSISKTNLKIIFSLIKDNKDNLGWNSLTNKLFKDAERIISSLGVTTVYVGFKPCFSKIWSHELVYNKESVDEIDSN